MKRKKKKGKAGKALVVALGLGTAGALAYLAYSKMKDTDSSDSGNVQDQPPLKKVLPILSTSSKKRKLKTTSVVPKSDSVTTTTTPKTDFNPEALAKKLREGVHNDDLQTILGVLRQIKNTDDYYLVSKVYITLRVKGFNKTIPTDLLDNSFTSGSASDSLAKAIIRKELERIGLKQNPTTKSWSLNGIRIYKDIITITDTYVVDSIQRKIPVQKNTILGEEAYIRNGMTWFKGLDGKMYSVPTAKVRYA